MYKTFKCLVLYQQSKIQRHLIYSDKKNREKQQILKFEKLNEISQIIKVYLCIVCDIVKLIHQSIFE